MARQYPKLTKKELQQRLKQYKAQGAKVSGSVAELDARLWQFEQNTGAATTGDSTPGDTSAAGGGGDIAESAPVLSKAHGAGSRPASPIKDTAAPLQKGSALRSVIYQEQGYHSVTIKCLVTLSACPVLHDGENDTEGEGDGSRHQQLGTSLLPVLALCEAIAEHTTQMVRTGALQSSFTVNLCNLQSSMIGSIKEVQKKFATALREPLVAELFQMFTGDAGVAPYTGAIPSTHGLGWSRELRGEEEEEEEEGYDAELQAALEESWREAQETAIDAQQAEITQYYEEQRQLRGEEAAVDDDDVGRGDVPPLEEVINQIPESGITFATLCRNLNIHLHDREVLEGFQQQLRPLVRLQYSKLFRARDDDTDAQLPSDEQVQDLLRKMGSRGMVFEDLVKYLNLRGRPAATLAEFRDSIMSRGVVVYGQGDRLVVPTTDTPKKGPLTGKPTLTPTVGVTGSASTPRQRDPEKVTPGSRGMGSAINMPPGQAAIAAPDDDESETSVLSPGRFRTSHPRLGMELDRIRNGILAHLRSWSDKFPEPAQGTWMIDFSDRERADMRSYIRSYLQANGMVGKPDTTDSAVDDLMLRADFPVAKGHHKAAIKSVVIECHTKKAMKGKAKAGRKAAGDGSEAEEEETAAVVEHSDGEEDNEKDEEDEEEAGTPAGMPLKRKRSGRLSSERAAKKKKRAQVAETEEGAAADAGEPVMEVDDGK